MKNLSKKLFLSLCILGVTAPTQGWSIYLENHVSNGTFVRKELEKRPHPVWMDVSDSRAFELRWSPDGITFTRMPDNETAPLHRETVHSDSLEAAYSLHLKENDMEVRTLRPGLPEHQFKIRREEFNTAPTDVGVSLTPLNENNGWLKGIRVICDALGANPFLSFSGRVDFPSQTGRLVFYGASEIILDVDPSVAPSTPPAREGVPTSKAGEQGERERTTR
jgi:hypothetical protein